MTLAIAHRGEPVHHVENTLAGIAAAIDAGADMVEVDVRLTADGVPVLLHDATLRRIWGDRRPLDSVPVGQVRALCDAAGATIACLAEAAELVTAAGRQLMVDLPVAPAGPAAYDLLADLGAVDAALFAGRTRLLRAHSATARVALTWDEPRLPDEQTMRVLSPEFFNPDVRLLTAEVADRMHRAGVLVSVWTVDDVEDMRAAIARGADAVITNRIADLVGLVGAGA